MLVLARRVNESIIIGNNVKVTIVEVNKGKIKLGIEAPPSVSVHREEVYLEIQKENLAAHGTNPEQVETLTSLLKSDKKNI